MTIAFPGKIHLISSDSELQAALPLLEKSTELGFDTETRPSFKKGVVHKVALLQLANETEALLIRLHHINQVELVAPLFENERILKVGVAIHDDIKQLQKTFSFLPRNFVDLQNVAKSKGLKNFGLKGMTEEVLQQALSKAAKITNWEAQELTEPQLMYAATDAWVSLKIFQKLNEFGP